MYLRDDKQTRSCFIDSTKDQAVSQPRILATLSDGTIFRPAPARKAILLTVRRRRASLQKRYKRSFSSAVGCSQNV
jgi:hypothetical protein